MNMPRKQKANPRVGLTYYMLYRYDKASDQGKVSPHTMTTMSRNDALAKVWAKMEVTHYGGVGYLYKNSLKIATVKAIPGTGNPAHASSPSAIPTRGQTYTIATKKGPVQAKFVGETFIYYFFQPVSGGRDIVMRKSTAGKRFENPAHGPMAIPTRWVSAKVSQVGKQIQIRVGGR